jgi:hypothetical protein
LYRGVFSSPSVQLEHAPASTAALVALLSAANHSRSFWREGWRIELVEPGRVVASQGARRRIARAHEYALTFAADLPPRPGMAATLFFPRESLILQRDVYYAFGEAIPDDEAEARELRFYLHTLEDRLPDVFAVVTRELNRLEIPFTLKTMLAPHERQRLDATVLYVSRRNQDAVLNVLPRSLFTPQVPLFTREAGVGVGIAESPETGESFGMNRCRLVAEGVVDAWMLGRTDQETRLRAIEKRFRAAGIDWHEPHRNRPRPRLTVENVVSWLGLDGSRWHVTDCSRRNRNFAVAAPDGSGYFVKQLRVRGLESLRMMEREAEAIPLAGDLAPRLLRFDEAAEALVFELLPHGEAPPLALAVKAAATLRRLHALAFPGGEGQPPGILTAHRGGPLTQWLSMGQLEVIERIRSDDVLAPALDTLAADWKAVSLIHGDVKWDNCLWIPSSTTVKWVDWELADAGDPYWDAGCFAQSYLSHFVATGNDGLQPAFAAFLDEYGGDTARIFRYAAARMLQTALECMHGQPHPTPLASALLERSRQIF